MSKGYEFTGKSVEGAIASGLGQLGLTQEQVEIEVLSEGRRGLLGIGSADARVRIVPLPAPEPEKPALAPPTGRAERRPESPRAGSVAAVEEAVTEGAVTEEAVTEEAVTEEAITEEAVTEETIAEEAVAPEAVADARSVPVDSEDAAVAGRMPQTGAETDRQKPKPIEVRDEDLESLAIELLQGLLTHMDIRARIVPTWRETPEDGESQLLLDIQGDDLGVLIGRRGETLANIQYLLRLMVNQRIHHWTNIMVDVEQYKTRREERLSKMALRLADQVVRTGKPVALEPMPPAERRLVHLALREHTQVYTQSVGEGDRRKVQILLYQ